MTTAARQLLTPAEYLAIERAAEQKSEFYAGEMFAMAGASPPHVLITGNFVGEIHAQLKGGPCRVFPSDLRVKVSETGLYTYPDVTVVCGGQRFDDEQKDTLINPTLIVEVLSPTTEAYDRGAKFAHFRSLESLQEYVLVAQDRPHIERYARRSGNTEWVLTVVSDPASTMSLPSIGCRLVLSDIYAGVEFSETEPSLWPRYDRR